jgi:hypothetical protein
MVGCCSVQVAASMLRHPWNLELGPVRLGTCRHRPCEQPRSLAGSKHSWHLKSFQILQEGLLLGTSRSAASQVSTNADPAMDVIKALRKEDADVRSWFFDVLKHHHPDLSGKLSKTSALADKWCTSGEQADFDQLEDYLENLMPNEAILVRFLPETWLRLRTSCTLLRPASRTRGVRSVAVPRGASPTRNRPAL